MEAKSRQALDTAEALGNVSVRMLGTCTHLVVVLPEERRHLLLLHRIGHNHLKW